MRPSLSHNKKWLLVLCFVITFTLTGCSQSKPTTGKLDIKSTTNHASATSTIPKLKNNIKLSQDHGPISTKVNFTIDQLKANQPVTLKWTTADGHYKIQNLYTFVGPEYTQKEIILANGTSNSEGIWQGQFTVPKGFGGDHTLSVLVGSTKIGQANFRVDPTFSVSPKSGPIGTEITIKAEGIGSTQYNSNWQLTYDNKFTGMLSAVSTNGTATAKIRAAGPVGKHTLTIWHGYLGFPYINHAQAPNAYLPVPNFVFTVTNDKPKTGNRIDSPIQAADHGVKMPQLVDKTGVAVTLDHNQGIVGQPVTLDATGLPKDHAFNIVWNTMRGSRITSKGFSEKSITLGKATTDNKGHLIYSFKIPNDLGGIPHRIDLKSDKDIYGQAYLRITPSIVSISPKSGPVGTSIKITINGGGWTEFDNTYHLTYDNAYVGYMCAFNSHGNLTFNVIASGDLGYHIIDLYPGIYRGKVLKPNIYNFPQLTYVNDHPGSAMPAIRMGFTVTGDNQK